MRTFPRKRKKQRLCRVCGKTLPASNWLHCNKCKKEILEDNVEEFPCSDSYSINSNTFSMEKNF